MAVKLFDSYGSKKTFYRINVADSRAPTFTRNTSTYNPIQVEETKCYLKEKNVPEWLSKEHWQFVTSFQKEGVEEETSNQNSQNNF